MIYTVQVKRDYNNPCADYTFEDAYFQGCEQSFNTEQEAYKYLNTFEDWERDLLTVDAFPF
jgi:hypothetical protein